MIKRFSIGEKIKRKRKELNMTLRDLAGDKITVSQISLMESGKSKIAIDHLEYFANVLDTPVEYFLESGDKQAIKICNFYVNMAICDLYEENFCGVEEAIKKISSIADEYNLEFMKYKVYLIRGKYFYSIRKFDDAAENILIANFGFLKFPSGEELIESFLYLGYISMEQKNYLNAISNFKSSIEFAKKQMFFEYDVILFKVYYLISKSYMELGYYEKAKIYMGKSIHGLNKIYKIRDSALDFRNKAKVCMENNQLENAIKFSKISRKCFERFYRLRDRQFVEINISNTMINQNEFNNVEMYLTRAKNLRDNYGFDDSFEIYKNFTRLSIKNGNLNRAKCFLEKVEKYLDKNKFSNFIDLYMLNYEINVSEENFSEAEIYLIMSYNVCKDFGEYEMAGNFCVRLSKHYIENNRMFEAENIIKEALVQYGKVGYEFGF